MSLIRSIFHQLEVPSLSMNFEVDELATTRIRESLLAYLHANAQVELLIEMTHITNPEILRQWRRVFAKLASAL